LTAEIPAGVWAITPSPAFGQWGVTGQPLAPCWYERGCI